MASLTHRYTTYIDHYLVDVPLPAVADHPPIRATKVVVKLRHVPDEPAESRPEVILKVTGERIVETERGYTTTGSGHTRVYGLAEEEVRYSLCRDAILESLRRHDLDPTDVQPFPFLDDWAEHQGSPELEAVDLSGVGSENFAQAADGEL